MDPESSCFEHEMESPGTKRRRVCEFQPKHDIFLSHSGQEKAFVEQLYHDLKRRNQRPFFDQESNCLPKAEKFASQILEAAEHCRLGVVVVSEAYLTSKWPMLELSKFVECGVKLLPLFLKLSPSDLKGDEVETKWKHSWRQLVERGEVKEDMLELWTEAVKELRSSTGSEYGKFANSEYKYRCAVVDEICKVVPAIVEWSTDGIQGYERLCKVKSSMFTKAKVMDGDKNVHMSLGLYGMGGVGKTTLCKAMCGYLQGEFGGRVCYVELPSDQVNEQIAGKERLARVKYAVQRLAGFDKSVSDSITEEQGWECLKNGLRDQPAVFLAIDNVGDFESSRNEARRYLNVGLPSGSKVLVTARSREILKSVLGQAEYCKPMPRLERLEAARLFLSYAAPNISSVSSLKPEERRIVERCLSECQFEDKGYPSKQYHPLVLRALGTYFHDVDSDDVMSWDEASENKNKLQRSREARNVNDILGLNYHSRSEQVKLVFLDSALYYPHEGDWALWGRRPWWCMEKLNDLSKWVSWMSEVHGVSPSDAKMMVKELQRLCLVEDSNSVVSIHDLYKEFARVLVEKEGSGEWQWWMSQSSSGTRLKRLVLQWDKSILGRTPRRFLEWRSLVYLEVVDCVDIGPDVELGSFHSLRVLNLSYCCNVKRVVCSCNKGGDDRTYCYKREPSRGCMSELLTVNLHYLGSLEDVPFLRHCWNLERLDIYDTAIDLTYPATQTHVSTDPREVAESDSESGEPIELRYLKALRMLTVDSCRCRPGYDCEGFIRWLLKAVELENLTAFECRYDYRKDYGDHEGVGDYTVDLSEAVHLPPRLSVLSLALPKQIEEVKGLHLLSELTTLNLTGYKGLRRLPDLECLPKLKWMCVFGCWRLEAPRLGPGVQNIPGMNHRLRFGFGELQDHKCLQRCYDILRCRNIWNRKMIYHQSQSTMKRGPTL